MPFISDNMAVYHKLHWCTNDELRFCNDMAKKNKLDAYITALEKREVWVDKIGTYIDMGAIWDEITRLKNGGTPHDNDPA